MNEVLSDAAITKRLQKQIIELEKQLSTAREKYVQKEKEIQWRKERIISDPSGKKADCNRRKTWAAVENGSDGDENRQQNGSAKGRISQLRFEQFGCNIEQTNEEFNSSLSDCIEFQMDDNDLGPTLTARVKDPSMQLRTPKSFRAARRSDLLEPESPSIVTEINKEKRIKNLENEIDELQQFQNMEYVTAIQTASK